jgi:hypothetical protein
MDIVSNCHPTWTHYTDSEPTSLCILNREAKNTNFIVFGLTRPEHEPMSTRTLTFTPLSTLIVDTM